MQKEFLLLLLAFSLVLFVKRPIKCREGEKERTKEQGNTFARTNAKEREEERGERDRERKRGRERESYAYEPGIFLTAKLENYFQT
jgi:hypothetical protein